VKPGQTRVDLVSGGQSRWYLRHVPPSYRPPEPMPVVVDLHGYSEGAVLQTTASALGPYGDLHGFLTITPEGSGQPRFVTWDTALDSTDVRFIGDVLDQLERTLCVDQRRVFVTGYSQGAFMASTLACVYADRIAAVATVAGIRDAPGCRPGRAVPVVAFHGTDDRHIAYTGGLGPDGLKLPAYDGSGKTMGEEGLEHRPPLNGAPIPVIAGAWAKRNGCTGPSSQRNVASDVTRFTWPCPSSRAVELYRVNGGGHTWPGSKFTTAAASILGHTTASISADAIAWHFFQAHPLRDP
jgi:polyhydroxybutyrate depolymerase